MLKEMCLYIRMTNTHYHIVLSPKVLLESLPIENWLKDKSLNHILSLEHGKGGHPHYDIFCELPKVVRTDSLKRTILKLYPDIPKSEQKNIKICQNTLDPNPMYGYGYTLKEGEILSSTFDIIDHDNFSKYYQQHQEKIDQLKKAVKGKKPEHFSLKNIGLGCVAFVKDYYSSKSKIISDDIYDFLIIEYLKSVGEALDFELYSKINTTKLKEFVAIKVVDRLLDYPLPQSPHLSSSSHLVHPMLSDEKIDLM